LAAGCDNPKTRLLYIPLQQTCAPRWSGKNCAVCAGKRYVGTDAAKTRVFAREGADHIGEVQAWDLDTGKLVWTILPDMGINWGIADDWRWTDIRRRPPTAKFRALDATSGKLFGVQNQFRITGVPVRMVDGIYIAAIGLGRGRTKMVGRLAFDEPMQVPQGGVVWVFAVRTEPQTFHIVDLQPTAAISSLKRSRSA
jgi:alcohol dehydrogenase (cytochrome c)